MGVSQSETPDAPASFAMNRSGAAAEEEYTPEACEKELKSSTWNGGNYKHSAKPTYKYQSSKFKTLDPPLRPHFIETQPQVSQWAGQRATTPTHGASIAITASSPSATGVTAAGRFALTPRRPAE